MSDGVPRAAPVRPRITVVRGDITRERVDAIVNAANEWLVAGGGVDGAIHRAAGEPDLAAACASLGGCAPGDAKATPGFALPAGWIVHTVGPRWRGGGVAEDGILASCYRRSLEVAAELGASSIAFPAISTGAFGFPPGRAARIAIETIDAAAAAPVVDVRLVAFDEETARYYERLLAERPRPSHA